MTIDRTRILTVEDVAAWLALPTRTVQYLAATQRLRGAKLGRQWRFREADVERYVAEAFGETAPAAVKPEPAPRPTPTRLSSMPPQVADLFPGLPASRLEARS